MSGFLLALPVLPVGCRAGIQVPMDRRVSAGSLGLCWIPAASKGQVLVSSLRRVVGALRPGRHQPSKAPMPLPCLGLKPSLPKCVLSPLLFLTALASPGVGSPRVPHLAGVERVCAIHGL